MQPSLKRNAFQGLILALPITCLLFASMSACSITTASQKEPPSAPTSVSAKSMSPASSYNPNSASYNVGVADNLSLVTPKGRQLPLKVYYPQAKGSFPIIIFSHGSGGSKDFYAALGSFWASHGYVSIHPTHADSVSLPGGKFKPGDRDELIDYTLNNSQSWQERAADISQIIDSLDEIAQQAPQLQGKLDSQYIGVGGHSFGAYTAQLVGGATIDLPNGPKGQSFADKRVDALLLLSPQGRGQQGLNDSSWKAMTLPAMFMTGSNDKNATGEGPDWRREPFDLAPPGNKYFLFIKGANHFSFSGRFAGETGSEEPEQLQQPSSGRLRDRIRARIRQRIVERRLEKMADGADQKAIFEYVKMGSLAFWDAYLKADGSAKDYLRQKVLETSSDGEVTVSIR